MSIPPAKVGVLAALSTVAGVGVTAGAMKATGGASPEKAIAAVVVGFGVTAAAALKAPAAAAKSATRGASLLGLGGLGMIAGAPIGLKS